MLERGEVPIYEPGLDAVMARNVEAGRLSFTTNLACALDGAEAVFIAVGTPTRRGDELSQRDLAGAAGVSNGGIHCVLDALLDKGLIKPGNFIAAEDMRRYAYVLTPKGLSEKTVLTHRFLVRKRAEYTAMKEEIEALEQEVNFGAEMGPAPRIDRCCFPYLYWRWITCVIGRLGDGFSYLILGRPI